MGLLVGLPMKIFHILFVVLRVAWPVLLILLIWMIRRRLRRRAENPPKARRRKEEPHFDGPVVEVDYRVVDEEREDGT